MAQARRACRRDPLSGRDHGLAMQRPSRHTGTGSAARGQLCGAHSTALQVAPKAAWSSSTCARKATRFTQVGKQQSAADVTGVSGKTVVAQSTSAVHSCRFGPESPAEACGGAGCACAGAGLGATTGVGPLLADSPHAIASGRVTSRDIKIGRGTPRSMSSEPGSRSLRARHRDAR